jgi:outer membrane protein OmpA-like peptidoglycan-associated protein
MDKRTIFSTSFCLFFAFFMSKNLFSQNKNNALGKSPLADYPTLQAAQLAFQRDLKNGNEGDKTWANIGLAYFNLERDSLELAFFHADTAAKMYLELNEKRQEQLAKKGWQLNGVRTFVSEIIGKAFEKTKKVGDLDAWNNFLSRFPKPLYAGLPTNRLYTEGGKIRNDLLCVELQKERDSTRLLTLLRDHERDLRRGAPDCYRTGAARQLQMAMYGKSWSELKNFFKANPRHPLSTDPARDAFVAAMATGDFRKMQEFSKTNAQSAYAQIALDSAAFYVYPYLKKQGDFNNLLAFYRQFPNSSYTPELDAYFAERIRRTDLVNPFRKDQTPNLSLRYLPQTEAALYAFYRRYGSEWAINEFITQHFDYKISKETLEKDMSLFRMGEDTRKAQDFIKAAPETYAAFRVLQKIIRPELQKKNWAAAAKIVSSYRPFFGGKSPQVDSLLAILERPLSDTKTENLGGNVNMPYVAEYCPVISADNRTLYFCRNNGQEDVYVTRRDLQGDWTLAQICKGLDSRVNEAPMALSADGNRMLLYKEAKLYFTDKNTEGGWTDEIPMSANINASVWQAESSFSADGKVLVFESRQRNDCIGLKQSGVSSGLDYKNENIDLFVSFKTGENEWSRAFNLSNIINTPYRERSPFLHPDGRTLYFCSEGHGGFGELDLYKTMRLDSTYLNWSPPIHVGKELNTASEDWGYKISTDGKYAFYSSNEDIWMASPLPPAAAPLPTRLVTGRLNTTGGSLSDALIIVIDKTRGDTVTTLRPDPKTGEYIIVVPDDKNYEAVVVSRKNEFLPATVNLKTPPSVSEGKDDIQLIRRDDISGKDMSFTLKNLNFDYDKAIIQTISYTELDRWADVLIKNNFKASIEGHTDNKGNDAHNEDLSKRRAEAAKAYLITKGCNPEQIEAKGFGEKIPIATNDTEEGRALNRRVEIKIRKVEKQ